MGAAHRAKIRCKTVLFLFPLLGAVLLSSCSSIPRIIILKDPLTIEEHLSLGLAYEAEGELGLALEEYKKAYKKDKKDFRPLFYIGNVHYRKKEFQDAEYYYLKAIKRAPEEGDILNNLSWAYMDNAQYEPALDAVEKAIRIDRNPFYLDTLANVYDRMGRYEEAIEVMKEALERTRPEDRELLYNEYKLLTELYEKTGENEKARQIKEKMKEILE